MEMVLLALVSSVHLASCILQLPAEAFPAKKCQMQVESMASPAKFNLYHVELRCFQRRCKSR